MLAVTSDVPILRARLTEGWVSMFYMNKESVSISISVSVPVSEVEIGLAGKFTSDYR